MKYYPLLLSFFDTLNDWNEKLDLWASHHMDSVGFGVGAIAVILGVSIWGIGALNKRQ